MGEAMEDVELLYEALHELPPSAKLVAKTLEYEGELTQAQLVDETALASRTVRYALNRLQEEGIVESDVYFADARQNLYSLTEALDGYRLRSHGLKEEIEYSTAK